MKKVAVLCMFLLISCTKEKKVNNKVNLMEKYKNQAITYGDDFSYGTYIEYAYNKHNYMELLSLSLIMNHKYKNIKSYYNIYKSIIELDNDYEFKDEYLTHMNSADVNFALYYLKEGAKSNDGQCQETLEYVYRKGFGLKQDIKKSDSLYSILETNHLTGEFYRKNREDKSGVDRNR